MGEKHTINYNGMELPCIESGYWPKGVTLVRGDEIDKTSACELKAICLFNGVAFFTDKETSAHWKYWAILPPKPATRRLTNRELAGLCDKGYRVLIDGMVHMCPYYGIKYEDCVCNERVTGVRAPNTDEWLEPTTDLPEVAK